MQDFYFGNSYKVPDRARGVINDKMRDLRKDYGSFRKYLDKIEQKAEQLEAEKKDLGL